MTAWFILKILHVFAAVSWLGGAMTIIFFLAPSVAATAPAGGAVMAHLNAKMKLPMYIANAAWITTLSGLALFYHIARGNEAYLGTMPGIALSLGALFGIVAFILAVFVQVPRGRKIGMLSAEAGGSPSAEQAAVISAEQRKFKIGGHIAVTCGLLSLLGMLMSHPI